MLLISVFVLTVTSFVARELHYHLQTRDGDSLYLQVHPSGRQSVILESDGILTDNIFFSTYLYYQDTGSGVFNGHALSVIKMIGDMMLEQYDISDAMTNFRRDEMSDKTMAILVALREYAPSLAMTLNHFQIDGLGDNIGNRQLLPSHLNTLIPNIPSLLVKLLGFSLKPFKQEIDSKLTAWEKTLLPQLLSNEFSFTWTKQTAQEGKSTCTVQLSHGRLQIHVSNTGSSIDDLLNQMEP